MDKHREQLCQCVTIVVSLSKGVTYFFLDDYDGENEWTKNFHFNGTHGQGLPGPQALRMTQALP